jgi:prepilin-type N-terminal cleavage/methylation domain-containing protein/prepilin-type processing-associated H-X9-DG protein
MKRIQTTRGAFTLVEMIVVVAIIALLAAILLPALGRARQKARQATCQNNLKQIFVALKSYMDDENEAILTGTCNAGKNNLNWYQEIVRRGYLIEPLVFICPSDVLRCTFAFDTTSPAMGNAGAQCTGGTPGASPTVSLPDGRQFNLNTGGSSYGINFDLRVDTTLNVQSGPLVLGKVMLHSKTAFVTECAVPWFADSNTVDSQIVGTPRGIATGSPLFEYVNNTRYHDRGNNVLYLDGHVSYLAINELSAGSILFDTDPTKQSNQKPIVPGQQDASEGQDRTPY